MELLAQQNFVINKYFIKYNFAKITLSAGNNCGDDCGSNGLPITPNSISIIGNFQSKVDSVQHPNIVQYVDCYRSKNEKVCLVFEYYDKTFGDDLDTFVNHLLHGLYFLHNDLKIAHGAISPDSIVYDGKNYKWIHWALNTITESGKLLNRSCLLSKNVGFVAPERSINLKNAPCRRSDIWSFGMLLLHRLYPTIRLPRNPVTLVACKNAEEILKKLNVLETLEKYRDLIVACLNPKPSERPKIRDLFDIVGIDIPKRNTNKLQQLILYDKIPDSNSDECPLTIKETYYFWCLSSTSTSRVKESTGAKQTPPILKLPSLVILDSPKESNEDCPSDTSLSISFISDSLEQLPMDNLKRRLNELDPSVLFPVMFSRLNGSNRSPKNDHKPSAMVNNLPIVIRESDFAYQVERNLLFRRLTNESPFLLNDLIRASKIDIPPLYRARTWANILGVKWNDLLVYDKIDKVTPTSTDRQISVDIPRCHQYNDLLASPQGHNKLTRILKAWLRHNEPNYVYWQGLDSLSAPFVLLNFNDEAMAFASFNAFIHKYLRGFFFKDNSSTIQEYLSLFSHLIAFHDVPLFNHLYQLNFTPELYCIPWFLTMFTHVLPLYKILHVWDTLLLGDESFPLAIGLSLLIQLRDQLLGYSFNDCILISSDLPEINVELCVRDAIKLLNSTPPSAIKRGIFPLKDLLTEICPRIEFEDLVDLYESGERVYIVDRRSEEEVLSHGMFKESIRECEIDLIKSCLKDDYYLVAVINDLPLASQLVLESVPRVVSILLDFKIPRSMCVASNGTKS
ncbi:TBC domain-containing protein kinase-like protein isoform X2 [Brevipalpus obovatus]|uniref:TBC domain-containing protein kinase-like protein isoform X2 n=1 Tax=Brevipalpus obovatus TaxID=246614 RepID=UPI003D9E9024